MIRVKVPIPSQILEPSLGRCEKEEIELSGKRPLGTCDRINVPVSPAICLDTW